MRILSALFDVALLPLAVAKDVFTAPIRVGIDGKRSFTREKIEEIEDNL